MAESRGGHPIQFVLIVGILVGGGWYFFKNYKVSGLDAVSVQPKDAFDDDQFVSYRVPPDSFATITPLVQDSTDPRRTSENPFTLTASTTTPPNAAATKPQRRYRKLRIASWALDGFGPTKFARAEARKNLANVVRQFDIVALQQVASIQRDLIPRLVDFINQGDAHYDYVMGESSGPKGRQEQLVFIFDRHRVAVDRSQTYTVDDPQDQLAFDPLVSWFRAAEPPPGSAWTFSLVNIRIDLGNAPREVALLPNLVKAIRQDGRGEDDVVLCGLFQADDAYLVPSLASKSGVAVVQNRPTDIFGKYQTSNILLESAPTSEFLGGGGVYDYPRRYGLSNVEAEAVTSHLPVYGEFTANEGGQL